MAVPSTSSTADASAMAAPWKFSRASTSDLEEGRLSRARRPLRLRQVDACSTLSRGWRSITSRRNPDPGSAASSTTCIPSKRDIAMVFQSYALYPNMSGQPRTSPSAWRCAASPKPERDDGGRGAWPRRCRSSHLLDPPPRASSPAASVSAWRWAGRWCASRACSCSTNRCRTSTPSCASTCASRSRSLHQENGNHHRLCHPRSDRGDDARHQDRGAEATARCSRSAPGNEIYNTPGQFVRRRFHGLAVDEPAAGADRQP